MSILDNESHDPNGLGNQPSRGEIERLRTENDRLRTALEEIIQAVDGEEPTCGWYLIQPLYIEDAKKTLLGR